MASNTETLKSFLISLGWKVDTSSAKKFQQALTDTDVAAAELAAGLGVVVTAVAGVAVAITAAVEAISDKLEKLYYASQRTKASAENIQALGYAASQMGSTVEGAQTSLENFARFLRTRPAAESWIQSMLGVSSTTADGQKKDAAQYLEEIGMALNNLKGTAREFQITSIAQQLGMDERTMFALMNNTQQFTKEYKDMLAAVGLDAKATEDAHGLMVVFRELGADVDVIEKKFGSAFGRALAGPLAAFQKWFTAHLPAIGKAIEWLADTFAVLTETVVGFAKTWVTSITSVWDWLLRLDPALKTVALAVAALGAVFLIATSPILAVVAAFAALYLLLDDYETFKRGGKSLIDWKGFEGPIENAIALFKTWRDMVVDLATTISKWLVPAIQKLPGVMGRVLGVGDGGGHDSVLNDDGSLRDKQWGGDPTAPRGLRNNNPGNIEYGPFARQQGSDGIEGTPRDNSKPRFAHFDTPQAGLDASATLLANYGKRGIDTINGIIEKWAAGDPNRFNYERTAAHNLGVSGDLPLDLHDPAMVAKILQQISQFENGKNAYSADMYAKAAAKATGDDNSRAVQITQNNTTTVTGVKDPDKAASAVDSAQKSRNDQIRNFLPVVYR